MNDLPPQGNALAAWQNRAMRPPSSGPAQRSADNTERHQHYVAEHEEQRRGDRRAPGKEHVSERDGREAQRKQEPVDFRESKRVAGGAGPGFRAFVHTGESSQAANVGQPERSGLERTELREEYRVSLRPLTTFRNRCGDCRYCSEYSGL